MGYGIEIWFNKVHTGVCMCGLWETVVVEYLYNTNLWLKFFLIARHRHTHINGCQKLRPLDVTVHVYLFKLLSQPGSECRRFVYVCVYVCEVVNFSPPPPAV